MPLLHDGMAGIYFSAAGRVLRALALAWQAQAAADADERDDLVTELDELTRWLAERAADAPENFLHLRATARGRAGLGDRRLPRRSASPSTPPGARSPTASDRGTGR